MFRPRNGVTCCSSFCGTERMNTGAVVAGEPRARAGTTLPDLRRYRGRRRFSFTLNGVAAARRSPVGERATRCGFTGSRRAMCGGLYVSTRGVAAVAGVICAAGRPVLAVQCGVYPSARVLTRWLRASGRSCRSMSRAVAAYRFRRSLAFRLSVNVGVCRSGSSPWSTQGAPSVSYLGAERYVAVCTRLGWALVKRQLASTPGVAAQAGQCTRTSPCRPSSSDQFRIGSVVELSGGGLLAICRECPTVVRSGELGAYFPSDVQRVAGFDDAGSGRW